MYQPFVAASAPVTYPQQQQQQQNQQVFSSGIPTTGYGGAAVPAYGMMAYPTGSAPPAYQNLGYSTPHQQGGPTYQGLDAAVYSAASAMLVERGIAPQAKTYNQNISGYPTAMPAQSSEWNRIESMNPTTPVGSASSSRGGRGGGGGGRGGGGFLSRGGRGGARGGYAGRYGNEKPKDPANQAVHYCEVCKVSCAGQASFQAHMIGSKHKKREQQVKWEKEKAEGAEAGAAAPTPTITVHGVSRATTKCELCGILTAGAAAFDAHIKGKSHQRTLKLHMSLGKPIPANEPTVMQRTVDTVNPRHTSKPELTTGSSVCTKVVTGGKTVLITPKMNFVGGTVLHTTESGLQEVNTSSVAANGASTSSAETDGTAAVNGENGAAQTPKKDRSPRRQPAPKHTVNPNSTAEPIGESYVQKTEKAGKVAYYKCTLCDCDFSDESGMNSHIRGRRHRLAYQKKVDPSIIVELPNSQKKARAIQEARALSLRGGRGGAMAGRGKRPAPVGPYGGPPGPKRLAYAPHPPPWGGPPHPNYGGLPGPVYDPYGPAPHYGGPPPPGPYGGILPLPHGGGPPQQSPYYPQKQHVQQGPGFQAPPMEPLPFDQDESFDADVEQSLPPPVRQAPRLDQHYLMTKHRSIVPVAKDLDILGRTVSNIERALKNLTEKMTFPVTGTAAPSAEDIAADVAAVAKPAQKMLKGSFRFGELTKNLLNKDNMFGQILLIATKHPTAADLDLVADSLQTELKVVCPLLSFAVVAHVDQCGIFVKALQPETPNPTVEQEPSFPVWIYLAYGNLRDELFRNSAENAAANGDGSPEKAAATGAGISGETAAAATSGEGAVAAANTTTASPVVAAPSSTSSSSADTTVVAAAVVPAAAAEKASAMEAFHGGLDLKRSLAVLAQSRRTRWFQEFITFFPQCRMLMRILNHICEHNADLRLLVGWSVEYLTITTLRIQAAFHGCAPLDIPLPEAFWMILSNVAGGAFLPGCPNGFKDPCERGNIDILGAATVEERVKVTKSVSELISRWLTGDYAKILDSPPLPGDPLYHMEVDQVAAAEGATVAAAEDATVGTAEVAAAEDATVAAAEDATVATAEDATVAAAEVSEV
ncbi:putative Zinc finger RNA-binding protein [Hypsibius exemplaris]|uniref:Zinc finger RNA-binding protein n=1 Tax=Hypsibius exemplaris TaxID=2072580 RepID=A0A1W0WHE1_HYPEX|nr:putative Zinc finger RNA-binding protein [Hypsibius exemplaris]